MLDSDRVERRHGLGFVLLAALLIGSVGIGVAIPASQQVLVLGVLVAALGVPHGALDVLVARAVGRWHGVRGLLQFLAHYVLLALASLSVWLVAPGLALAVFLALSAWHFASDWDRALSPIQRLAAGIGVISVPCVLHADEVAALFTVLATPASATWLAETLAVSGFFVLVAMLASAYSARARAPIASLEVIAVAGLALALDPVAFFITYFCGLHSPRHLLRAARAASRHDSRIVVAVGAATSAITLSGAGLVWTVLPAGTPEESLLQVVFIGLSVLTVPHMLIASSPGTGFEFRRRAPRTLEKVTADR